MIGVYIRHDATRIVKAIPRKRQVLHVIEDDDMPYAYYEALKNKEVETLVDMFKKIGDAVGILYEEIYIVLPDDLFYVDCGEYTYAVSDTNQMQIWLEERLNIKSSEFYTAFPMQVVNNVRNIKTSYSIKKEIIDSLIDAAKRADVSMVSVEPASFAYLRSIRSWKNEHCILETCQDTADFVSFSPIAGIFRLPMQSLALKNLKGKEDDMVRQALRDALAEQDVIARRTFDITNIDVSVHLLGSSAPVNLERYLEELNRRAVMGEITSIKPVREVSKQSAVTIGTLLQVLDEDALYQDRPQYLQLFSANVLPAEIKVESRLQQMKKKTKQYCKAAILLFLCIVSLEGAALFYFNSFEIPDALQADYDRANQSIEGVKKELEILKQAKMEEQHPLAALNGLLSGKPGNLWFGNFEIGQQGKPDPNQWITCNVQAADPITFRDYVATIEQNTLFRGINIKQINTSSAGNNKELKTATITIGKGKV